ncbi:MAG: protein-glutamate O-methyltransferase [Phycisphaerales bacterium]|nr:protein-glutamate O-methyltransferase [Phycisphaerales bacterium]
MQADCVPDLTDAEYELFRRLIYDKCGINLGPQKQQLVRARLGKRMRAGQFNSYRAYYDFVRGDASGNELAGLIDAISTNTTHLFRESQHFEFVRKMLRTWLDDSAWRAANNELRCWSAGCSSGEEPYSLAMTLDDALSASRTPWRILATDISTQILDRARRGVYESHRLGTVPAEFRRRYFVPAGKRGDNLVQVHPNIQSRIAFAHLNLMSPTFPFRLGFHFIFCRNVMIYFDRATQEGLVERFTRHLRPGGHLIIGHSESLNAIKHALEYVQPTIYRKPER